MLTASNQALPAPAHAVASVRGAERPDGPGVAAADDAALRVAAEGLETSFLAVMLQSAGVGTPREAFGGGAGEAQFASFLAEAHAAALVERGGIGLAESLFHALKARSDATD